MELQPHNSTDFLTSFSSLIPDGELGSILRWHGPAKRSPATVSASKIVSALVFQLPAYLRPLLWGVCLFGTACGKV